MRHLMISTYIYIVQEFCIGIQLVKISRYDLVIYKLYSSNSKHKSKESPSVTTEDSICYIRVGVQTKIMNKR